MNENIGYIKLFRKLENTEIWADPFKVKLWLLILFRCSYEDKKVLVGNNVIDLKKGQCVVGRNELECDFNKSLKSKKNINFVSGLTLYKWLEVFGNLEMLNIKKTNKYSIITVLNWCEYQISEQQTNIKATSKLQQANNKLTSNLHKEEVKEVKELKEVKNKYGFYKHVLLTPTEFQNLQTDFENIDELITHLDEYIEMKGYRAKRHNLVIRKWVVDAVREKKQKAIGKKQDILPAYHKGKVDWSDMKND